MINLDTVALELLEYKLKDLQAERDVKGGLQSAWELYYHLSQDLTALPLEQRRQVEKSGSALKALGGEGIKARSAHDTFEALVLENFGDAPASSGDAVIVDAQGNSFILDGIIGGESEPAAGNTAVLTNVPTEIEEQRILQRLASDAWWHDVEGVMQQLAVRCRVEKDRGTARLLYALLRNVERYAEDPAYEGDAALDQFEVQVPVADHNDPLISLNDVDTLTELIREIISIVMTLGERGRSAPAMPRENSLTYLKTMALKIAQNPYAGKLTLVEQYGPTSDQLRLAIQELAREPMRAEAQRAQRLTLERRLQESLEGERRQKELFLSDVRRFNNLVETFFGHLEQFLPQRVGGQANDPGLKGGVLFAETSALRVEQVAPSATAITVRLTRPLRFTLSGVDIALTSTGQNRAIFVAGQERRLEPQFKIDLQERKLFGFMRGDYLHLNLAENTRSLALLLAEALCVLEVLSSDERDDVLRVIGKASGVSVAEPQARVLSAIKRLGELSARAPNRRAALEGLLRGAAKAQGVTLAEGTLLSVVRRIETALSVTAEDFTSVLDSSDHSEVQVHTLGGDPLSLRVGGQPVTVRRYQGRSQERGANTVVMLPGRIVGTFAEQTVQAFPGGTLLGVKSGDQLALLFFEDIEVA